MADKARWQRVLTADPVAAALADALDARMAELTDVPPGGLAPHPDLDARRPQWPMPAAGEARPSPRGLPAWLRRGGPRRRSWLLDMLRDGRLVTHFQPIVCANAPDAVLGYEALLRGQARDGTLVEPKPLYQAARATGLLFHLDRLARLTAIRGAAVHRVTTQLFINFTPSSIYDPASSLRSTMSAIAASGISSERIVLEVVESEEIRDVQHLLDVLDTYREAGFGVALDDLGAGYSSLNLLTRLKPELLKLDAELVHNVDADPYRAAIVAKLLELAGSLRIRTVAEGIETEGEWWWCREHDVDYVQGYLFARPGLPPPVPGLWAAPGPDSRPSSDHGVSRRRGVGLAPIPPPQNRALRRTHLPIAPSRPPSRRSVATPADRAGDRRRIAPAADGPSVPCPCRTKKSSPLTVRVSRPGIASATSASSWLTSPGRCLRAAVEPRQPTRLCRNLPPQ